MIKDKTKLLERRITMEVKGRHEFKHHINIGDYQLLRSKLAVFMDKDSHTNENGQYHIRSLYFDNDYDKILYEKLDGVDNRDKFRIRIYNLNDNIINLEKKSKRNGLCFKSSVNITKEETLKIINGDIQWLKNSEKELLKELYSVMLSQRIKPKTIVDYQREVYVYSAGNVRITFDMDIRTAIHSLDIFDKNLVTVPIHYDHYMVLEIKYDDFIPEHIAKLVQLGNRRNTTNSKYMLSRIYG